MGFICAICSESVEKTPSVDPLPDKSQQHQHENKSKSKLSAVPCGHIYHSYCIDKWMSSGGPSSSLCPNCRKFIPRRSCIELFPDSYDDSSCPTSPDPEGKAKHDKDIAALKSKLYRVEADFKIQLSLYELLTQDHQQRIAHFNEAARVKDAEIASLKTESATAKNQLETEVQKLKAELHSIHQKHEAEKNGRVDDRKKQLEFCDRIAAQMQAQRMEIIVHSLQFQADDDHKPGPSRLCPQFKNRPILSKPRRGKKMVYEKNNDSDEIEELKLTDSDDEDDIDIMSCSLDSRKRKLPIPRPRITNSDPPKPKMKRLPPAELSLSPITLTISSDSEEERRVPLPLVAPTTPSPNIQPTIPLTHSAPPPFIKMDVAEG